MPVYLSPRTLGGGQREMVDEATPDEDLIANAPLFTTEELDDFLSSIDISVLDPTNWSPRSSAYSNEDISFPPSDVPPLTGPLTESPRALWPGDPTTLGLLQQPRVADRQPQSDSYEYHGMNLEGSPLDMTPGTTGQNQLPPPPIVPLSDISDTDWYPSPHTISLSGTRVYYPPRNRSTSESGVISLMEETHTTPPIPLQIPQHISTGLPVPMGSSFEPDQRPTVLFDAGPDGLALARPPLNRRRCTLCGHDFRFPKDLRRHLRTHFEDRPFLCHVEGCQYSIKGFPRKDNLDRHIRTKHPIG